MDTNTKPSFEVARHYIAKLDLTNIIHDLSQQSGWSLSDAKLCEKLYKNFLILQKKYRHLYKLHPSEEIDDFWHMHILNTKQYHRDCMAIFGEYLHHTPPKIGEYAGQTGAKKLEKEFDVMQELYFSEFGEYL